jgi:hypothetical protein
MSKLGNNLSVASSDVEAAGTAIQQGNVKTQAATSDISNVHGSQS